ncbi:TauD/TfdA family dioxygenase [Siccirubricoccus sp. KC 17139]|uniref:TauD/TfdA family dioxygenase n=1 Tax=Siccirubricoccus soli TaxID=2899147 RepID=A0ABT1DBQ9_9PROT|nr:TauD/TfdA family dioxygenase [Siccirubricoccus soli]MCO6419329.1 TauD/TfdA family dioxygenase [Siccirubricoccus soli]MCP2685464.1 TauD/TfdA family dioxygenase [Siccirubricoccus soli]
MTLHLTPLHPLFVAEVRGIDLRTTPGPELCEEIHKAMDRYAVLVFRDQQIEDDQQMAFGEALGPLEQTRGVVDVHKQRLKHRQMADISNIDLDGKLLAADDRRRMFNLGNQLWHSDSSFKATPAKYSMLHARVIPPEGGETEYADMRAAWDALPAKMQDKLRDLVTDHSLIFSRGKLGFTDYTEQELRDFAPVPQRLVRWHPRSQRHSLYLSSHIGRIHGWPVPEALALIRQLEEFATQRHFVYTHRWRQWDIVMWDNRSTMHRARPYEDHTYPRDMRRVTLTDVAPTLEQQMAA